MATCSVAQKAGVESFLVINSFVERAKHETGPGLGDLEAGGKNNQLADEDAGYRAAVDRIRRRLQS